jgi:hypothetical protein
VENPCGKKNHGRQSVIFTMIESYNAGNTMSPLSLPCGLQDVYIWWTKLTAVKYGNKSAKHITRTMGPPGVLTRLTLRI